MKNLLLLIQSEADAKNLLSAAKWLVQTGVKNCWALMSPAVLLDSESAAAKINKDIADLRAAEEAAGKRKDYSTAEQFSKQADIKMLEKAALVANAYKELSMEEVKTRYVALLAPFVAVLGEAGMNFKDTLAKEHFELDNWLNFVNAHKQSNPFEAGAFGVVWAGELKEGTRQSVSGLFEGSAPKQNTIVGVDVGLDKNGTVTTSVTPIEKTKFDPAKKRTLNELEDLSFMALKSVGNYWGVYEKGILKGDLIRNIDKAQQATVAA